MAAPGKKKGPPKALTQDQMNAKIKLDHRALVRATFRGCGFHRISGISDKEFKFENQKSDFDDVFVYENLVLFIEYTASKTGNVGDHLKPKKIIYDKIDSNPIGFINFLKLSFPDSADQFPQKYHDTKLRTRIVYCSRYEFEPHYKLNVPNITYMDYPSVRYFESVVDAIKKSALLELL